ncbi:hypothetical protein QPK31_05530 [Massilia sp. YIM B02769]|uniref:hypothetical protein n=1 Tax=Massilia sp. YIM B02769 TaxID=3050129 RepID=UPI0025B6E3ED|nr:hypothetical protein [Massilia sp. YIM B02769]MDN4057686.1 hypothetical protein [Massilia sp. YIM B02769]
METEAEQAHFGSWSIFSFVSSAIILIAFIVAIFSMYRIHAPIEASMVRVANETGLPLQNVRINSVFFGDVPVDGVSSYQALTPAYRYAALHVDVAGKKFDLVPEDYVGETPLGRGKFTYRVRRQYDDTTMYFDLQDATRDTTE